jgi:hypothetical protein
VGQAARREPLYLTTVNLTAVGFDLPLALRALKVAV